MASTSHTPRRITAEYGYHWSTVLGDQDMVRLTPACTEMFLRGQQNFNKNPSAKSDMSLDPIRI